ncbi:MAG TPA: TolC family protein, partial [bacterium]|nr:TolC family protein [bacterium]
MVKRMVRLLMLCLLASAAVPAGAAELSLDECIARALRHNTGLEAVRTGQDIAEQGVVAARAGFLPNISGRVTSSQLDNYDASSGSPINGNNTTM